MTLLKRFLSWINGPYHHPSDDDAGRDLLESE